MAEQNYFQYDEAVKIIDSYFYLLARELMPGYGISFICPVPSDSRQYSAFISSLKKTSNPEQSLAKSGYNELSVGIQLIHYDIEKGNLFIVPLDEYLTSNKIAKVYDKEGNYSFRKN